MPPRHLEGGCWGRTQAPHWKEGGSSPAREGAVLHKPGVGVRGQALAGLRRGPLG